MGAKVFVVHFQLHEKHQVVAYIRAILPAISKFAYKYTGFD